MYIVHVATWLFLRCRMGLLAGWLFLRGRSYKCWLARFGEPITCILMILYLIAVVSVYHVLFSSRFWIATSKSLTIER